MEQEEHPHVSDDVLHILEEAQKNVIGQRLEQWARDFSGRLGVTVVPEDLPLLTQPRSKTDITGKGRFPIGHHNKLPYGEGGQFLEQLNAAYALLPLSPKEAAEAPRAPQYRKLQRLLAYVHRTPHT